MSEPEPTRHIAKGVAGFTAWVLLVPVASLVGTWLEVGLTSVSDSWGVNWVGVMLEPSMVRTVWASVLSLHGAIAAIAPVLGYTLLTAAAAPLARIAPAGFVVAEAIQWRKYLKRSLSLLIGSLLGYLVVPAIWGLVGAGLAAWYVIFCTYKVFKDGFLLLQNETLFDEKAREYLKKAVEETKPPKLSQEVARRRLGFNDELRRLEQSGWWGRGVQGILVIGVANRPTQLVSIKQSAYSRIDSLASARGFELFRGELEALPVTLEPGTHVLFVLRQREGSAVDSGIAEATDTTSDVPDQKAIDELQGLLNQVIQYGDGAWALQQRRVPMLILWHLDSVLTSSVHRRSANELRYGLSVLGDLIDHASEKLGAAALSGSETYRWVYELPSTIIGTYIGDGRVRFAISVELVRFLRRRLSEWMGLESAESLSKSYLGLLRELLEHAAAYPDILEGLLVNVREIPSLTDGSNLRGVRIVARELIILYLSVDVPDPERRSEKSILRTLHETISFSHLDDFEEECARLETGLGLLAASLFNAKKKPELERKVKDVVECRVLDFNDDGGIILSTFKILENIDKLVSDWRWDWWELSQYPSGEAHFLSMESWLFRAGAVILSRDSWALRHIENDSLPSLSLISRLLRSIDGDWVNSDFGIDRNGMEELKKELQILDVRRRDIVRELVAAAPIDPKKAEKYVGEVSIDLSREFGSYSQWMIRNGFSVVSESAGGKAASIALLLSKECFVSDDVGDSSAVAIAPNLSRSLLNFEISKIGEMLHDQVDRRSALGVEDPEIWTAVRNFLRGGQPVLVVGFGAHRYRAWREIEEIEADEVLRENFRFVSVNDHFADMSGVLVVRPGSVLLKRHRVPERGGMFDVRQDLESGGALVSLSVPGEAEIGAWKRADREASEIDRLATENLVFRVEWGFEVVSPQEAKALFFELPRKGD